MKRTESRVSELRLAVGRILEQNRRAALMSSAAALVLASAGVRAQEGTGTATTTPPPGGAALEEIVVSAQRRVESVQNVPYNISVVAADQLGSVNSLNDVTQFVAGLGNVDQGPAARAGNNNFVLRGLRADAPGGGATGPIYQNLSVSPVATYFGETPVFFPMPLDDVERIEVLRGPQGTLYGSGSLAGTIRFIPKRPDFDNVSGDLQTDMSYSQRADEPNETVHGVLNLPIADHLALRVVAGFDHLAGFIDAVDRVKLGAGGVPVPSIPGDLTSGFVLDPVQHDVNSSNQWFARAALRWQPISSFDAQFDYLIQNTSMADSQLGSGWPGGPWNSSFGHWPNTTVETRPGCTYCDTTWVPEPYDDHLNLMSLVLTGDLGLATVTSATSYYDDKNFTSFDQTGFYYTIPGSSAFIPYYPYLWYPRLTAPENARIDNHSFIEEMRLVSSPGKWFDYVLGLYYQSQGQYDNMIQTEAGETAYDAFIDMPSVSPTGDNNYYALRNSTFSDKAVFGELTWHITHAWQLTVGARFFKEDFTSSVDILLPLCGAICAANLTNPYGEQFISNQEDVNKHVKKIDTSYDISSNMKIYATYSEGFRRGGVAGVPENGPYASLKSLQLFQPDFAKNYEVGIKGTALDRRIRYAADLYLINLDNFQFNSVNLNGFFAGFNGKTARSQGVETEAQVAFTEHFSGAIGYAYTKAYVSRTFDIQDYLPYALIPQFGGTGQTASIFGGPIASGTKLPGVSRNVATTSANYTVPDAFGLPSYKLQLHLDASYRSSEETALNANSIYNWTIPSVFLANIRANLESAGALSYHVFINNVTNNPGYSGSINVQTFPTPFELRNVGRTRTYGVGVEYRFGAR